MAMHFPDCPAHDVKVRLMFNELDVRKTQAIDIEGMIVVFKRLTVGFSTATINDLFEKGDTNGDGVISLQEFRRFGECYPTLLDCLYYRAKDYWTEVAQKEGIDETKRMLDELREREDAARRAHHQARLDVEEAERRLQAQIQALLEAQRRETEAKNAIDMAHEATERARAELRDRVADLNCAKDLERQRQLELSERQRMLDAAIRRLQQQEAEVTKAQERLRDIERLLAEQTREVERQISGAERYRTEAEIEEEREREAHAIAAEALRAVHGSAEAVASAEERLAQIAEQEKIAAIALRDAAEDTSRQLARRDAEQKMLLQAKQIEAARLTEAAAATEAVNEQEHLLQQQLQENQDFVEKRRQVDDEEAPLVEQEVRLREQRENLERKENRLRSDFTAFAERSTHVRIESPRGMSLPLVVPATPPAQIAAVHVTEELPVISSPRGVAIGYPAEVSRYAYYTEGAAAPMSQAVLPMAPSGHYTAVTTATASPGGLPTANTVLVTSDSRASPQLVGMAGPNGAAGYSHVPSNPIPVPPGAAGGHLLSSSPMTPHHKVIATSVSDTYRTSANATRRYSETNLASYPHHSVPRQF
ncbi:flagellar protein essential for flagellar pocket biogenesis [Diplonema papillatum]|nr:flagellar protein essential for flagellar pocket biogenesis [Diplonema papillatum]